jgi:hypothetical protein
MKQLFSFIALFFLGWIPLQAQQNGDFRTAVASGFWKDASSWERFNGTDWVMANAAPTEADGAIHIQNGHHITIDDSTEANEIVVDAGGILTQASYLKYYIEATNSFLTVNGELNWTNGTFDEGSIVINASGNMNIYNPGTKQLKCGLVNMGTVHWNDGTILCTSVILNNNAFYIETAGTLLLDDFSTIGTQSFQNTGTVTKNGTGTFVTSVESFLNTGTVLCNAGVFRNESVFKNGGTLNLNGGLFANSITFQHNVNSSITGNGVFTSEGLQQFNTDQTLPSGITMNQTTGSMQFLPDKTLTIEGVFNWFNGPIDLNGNISINQTGQFNLTGSATKTFGITGTSRPFVLTNHGSINWQDGIINWSNFSSGIILNNHGQFLISGNNNDAGTNPVQFNNTGTFTKTSTGTTALLNLQPFTNDGTVQCNNGLCILDATVNNNGILTLSGGDLQFNGQFNQNNGGTFGGTGTLFNNGGTLTIHQNQQWPSGFRFQQQGEVQIANGITLAFQGTYNFLSGNISGPGMLEVGNNGTFNLESASAKKFEQQLSVHNLGEWIWKNGDIHWGAGIQTINNEGLFQLGEPNSGVTLDAVADPGSAIINNQHLLYKFTSTTSNLSSVTINNSNGKTIRGLGTININNFNNAGTLETGHPIGTLAINGAQPLSASSVLKLELSASGNDELNRSIGGALNLAGSLQVIQNGSLPNDSYRIIHSNTGFSGNFSSVTLPEYCSLQQTANDLFITRNGPLAGDYRTKQHGNWESPATWERFDGTNWVSTGNPDVSAGNISILHNVTVSISGITEADQITVKALGSLTISSRLIVQDGPGDDLLIEIGGGLYLTGGTVSGTGNLLNYGMIHVQGSGIIAVACTNNNALLFSRGYEGCCVTGQLNLTDQLTTGRIDNYGSMIIFASGGVYDMNIVNGEIYNHTNAQIQANYNTKFDVSKFTNEGEFIVGVTGVTAAVCTIKSAQSATHSGCRFKSNGNSMQLVMQTNGTFTYAADCIIDANMHYATGIHEIASSYYGAYDSRVSTTVNCVGSEKNFPGNVYVDAGNFGGPAIKRIGGTLLWPSGTISGGQLIINDTAFAVLGIGQTTLGILNTTLVNNGTVQLSNGHGGCCASPELNMTNGAIENNGQFLFNPSSGGGIRNVTFSGGTFHNNNGGTLINNASAVSPWGDNEIYLRNSSFNNEGTIQANGVSLNIFPTTDPVIHGNITVAAGSSIKLGIPSTTTTLAADAVINGAGTVYFFEGNHQVNTASYNVANTSIGQISYPANVYFNAPSVALNYVYMLSGILGGTASKLIKDDMVFFNGNITGGPISNTDTSIFYYGAGNTNLGSMNAAFTNNGTVDVNASHGGCCSEPVINLSGGSITNNGLFNVTGSGGIRYVGISNGTFVNNAGGIINSNVGDVPYGDPCFRMQPAAFTNNGTINVIRNKMEIGSFTVGGVINVATNCLLRSTGPVTFSGTLIRNDGEIAAPINYQTSSTKILQGNGHFNHPVTLNNAATLTPGNSPGIVTISGNYLQGGAALTIEIGGTDAGTSHDKVVVTGTATLSGTLNATEINGFQPTSFTSIDILTAAAVTGTFSQVNLPPYWSVLYSNNKVTLQKFNSITYYRDQDNDGFGNPADTIHRYETTAPAGYTTDSTDCNDSNAAINPAATEVCNGIDDNCDGLVDQISIPGIIVYMPLNGNATDLSANALNGTIIGNVTATTDRFGNSNSAMYFPGNTASYIRVNDQPLLRPSSITLAAWVKMDAQPGLTGFINKSINCYNDSWHFGSQGGNYSTWVSNSTNCGDFVQMTAPNSVGAWHHIAFTLDAVADVRKLYVDGQLVATGSYTSSIPYDGNPVLIGAAIENGNLDFPFLGSMDDVLIFNRAITATEINTLFTTGPIVSLSATYYADADGDGFGNPAVSAPFCSQPAGYVLNNTDCDDTRSTVYPGAAEICDGIDNNCDGQIDGILITTGLAAYYPFNGNAQDAIGTFHGTVTGATLTTDRFGNANQAYQFNGINQSIAAPAATTVTDNFSMTGWVNIQQYSNGLQLLFCNGNSSNSGWGLMIDATGKLYIIYGGVVLQATTAQLPLQSWKHLALVRSAGTTIVYVDGVSVFNNAIPAPAPVTGLLMMGVNNLGTEYFNGKLDDIKIYQTALTAEQVNQDFNVIGQITYYQDADGDGFGNPSITVTVSCGTQAPTGYVANNNDCNDNDANIYSGVQAGMVTGTNALCIGSVASFASNGQTGGTWSSSNTNAATVDPVSGLVTAIAAGTASITYTISSCNGPLSAAQTVSILSTPAVNQPGNIGVNNGNNTGNLIFSGNATAYQWSNDQPSIGLAANGTGNIPAFTAINNGNTPVVATITVTPVITENNISCTGIAVSFTIMVMPTEVFTLNAVPNQVVCAQTLTSAVVFSSSTPDVTYSWTNSEPSIGLAASGTGNIPDFLAQHTGTDDITATITVTPVRSNNNGGSINGTPVQFTIRVNHLPVVSPINSIQVCRESNTDPIIFSGAATTFNWTNSETGIGLPASGTGSIPSFVATNVSFSVPLLANIRVVPITNDGVTCQGISELFTIKVHPKPIMNTVANQTYCNGNIASVVFSGLAVSEYNWVSDNVLFGIDPSGTGNLGPAVVSNSTAIAQVTSFTVTPRYINNFFTCLGDPKSFTITVKPTPDLSPIESQRVCIGQPTADINFNSSVSGATFNWTNNFTGIGLAASGSGHIPSFVTTGSGSSDITVRASADGCLGGIRIVNIIVDPLPVVSPISNKTICTGSTENGILITNQSFTWTCDNPAIGLASTGSGFGLLPSFTAVNNGTAPISANITIIASSNNGTCVSAPVQFTITVLPKPFMNPLSSVFYCSGTTTAPISFESTVPGATYTWSSNNALFPLPTSGTGNIPSFPAINSSNAQELSTGISVSASYALNNQVCYGTIRSFNLYIRKKPALFNLPGNRIVCHGQTISQNFNGNTFNYRWTNDHPEIGLPAQGTGNISFVSSNNSNTAVTATITVTPISDDGMNCAGDPYSFTIRVNPAVTINPVSNQEVCNGSAVASIAITGNAPNTVFNWVNNGANIGLAMSGSGNIPSFQANNTMPFAQTANYVISASTNDGVFCTIPNSNFSILVQPTPVLTITASGSTTFCEGGSVTLTSDRPTGNLWSNGANTQSITVNNSGTYTATNNIYPVCSAAVSNAIVVTVTASQASAVSISTASTTVCRQSPVTFTAAVVNVNAPSYRWFVNNVQVSTNATFTSSTLTGNAVVRCTITGNNPCNNNLVTVQSNNITITVIPSVNAGTISGASMITQQAVQVAYTSNGLSGGTWSTDNAAVLSINSTTGFVNAIATGSANIRYTVTNACGTNRASKLVTVVANTDIVGPELICFTPNETYVYTFNAQAIPVGGTYSSSNPAVATAAINTNHGSIRVTVLGPGTTTISYNLPNNGGSISKTITVVNNSVALQPIEGPRNLCRYAIMLYVVSNPANLPTFTYTRPAAFPSTGYNWSVPDCMEIVSGQGTTTLTVRLISDRTTSALPRVYATPINYCSNVTDPYYVDIVIWGDLATPSAIVASSTNICESIRSGLPIRYTINKVPEALFYDWILPPGVEILPGANSEGPNDTFRLVRYTNLFQSGNISVYATNGCNSPVRSLTVTRVAPAMPSLISGPTNTCANQLPNGSTATYSVPAVAGMTYNWTVPAGITGFTGQGSNSISFKFPNGFTSGSISVTATNGCGTSAARILNVASLNPATPSVIDVIQEQACPNRIYSYAIASMPANSSGVLWEIPAGGTILSGQGTQKIFVGYLNTSISGKVKVTALANCRNSNERAVAVKLPACPPSFGKGMLADKLPEATTTEKMQVFPNPSAGQFRLQLPTTATEHADIRLYNNEGKIIRQWQGITSKTLSFGSELNPGTYLIECRMGDTRQTLRIVKL